MKLWRGAFCCIANGSKTIELRLNDEKRQKITVGDTIVFNCSSNNDIIEAQVNALHKFKDFEELYNCLPLDKCGYKHAELATAHYTDMNAYYSEEQIKKHGALGIELCNVKVIFDIKSELLNEQIYNLLSPSVFNPTAEKLLFRAQRYIDSNDTYAYVFLQDGKYVGIMIFEIKDSIATINDISVNAEFRGKGIGSKLVHYISNQFAVKTITAQTDDDAVGFYEKCGFKIKEIKTEFDSKRYFCKFSSNCT